MYKTIVFFLFICQLHAQSDRHVGGRCDGCELMLEGMDVNSISTSTSLVKSDEPGEKMLISGKIFKSDGKTPATDVILYLYHTDQMGKYTPSPNQQHAKRHGHIRGWVKPDANGHYSFTTIRPASYPNTDIAQHIHPTIKEKGLSPYYIDEYLFKDDPKLTPAEIKRQEQRGGSGIITLRKNAQNVWVGERNIVLGKNIPGY